MSRGALCFAPQRKTTAGRNISSQELVFQLLTKGIPRRDIARMISQRVTSLPLRVARAERSESLAIFSRRLSTDQRRSLLGGEPFVLEEVTR